MTVISSHQSCATQETGPKATALLSHVAELVSYWERRCSVPQKAERISLDRHHSLNRKGEAFQAAYIVMTGQLKLVLECPQDSRPSIIRFVMPGQFIGLEGFALPNSHLRAIALEDAELSALSFASIRHCAERDFSAGVSLVQSLCQDLQDSHSRPNRAYQSPEQRFALFLLQHSRAHQRCGYSDTSFRLAMCRSDIASYTDLAGESVSRIIRRFDSVGITTIEGRQVTINDLATLTAIAQGKRI